MRQLVECVPNFSDGRRPEVYNAIADAIRSVPHATLLDLSADPDHNRTVITFAGPPEAVEEAAFRAIAQAAQLIDLDEHKGEHPRIGATDVVPFIPMQGVSLKDCVAIARRLGQRVGDELGIAVYLYEAAATRPEREKLAHIRRGEYERWKEEIGQNPEREPDFGPATPQKWGATVIGARPFLIAYNIYLNSDDVDVAERIARTVRFSSGGLRFVQAKGFLVDGQAQVSMNLTNHEKTPVHLVQETVRREAAAHGLSITRAELVGLIPQQALLEAAQWYLQLHDLAPDQTVENRLQAATEAEATFTPYEMLAATADARPTPGGGSAAALAGALAAALTQMVAGLTTGRKKYADVEAETAQILEQIGPLREALTEAVAADAAAFEALMDSWRIKDMEKEARLGAIEAATRLAGEVPLTVARLSRQVAELALTIARIGNSNAATDAAAGVLLANAAVQIAGMNVRVNGLSLRDPSLAAEWQAEVARLVEETAVFANQIPAIAAERAGYA